MTDGEPRDRPRQGERPPPASAGDPRGRGDGHPPDVSRGKPTPVRATMGEEHPGKPTLRFEGRTVRLGEEEWWAQELGWTHSGRREDQGALLLLVGFRRSDDAEGDFRREALLVADSLEEVAQSRLEEVLAMAGPFRSIPEEPKPFFGPRGSRRRGPPGPRPRPKGRGRRGRG